MAIISDEGITSIAYTALALSTCFSVVGFISDILLMRKLKFSRPQRWKELHTVGVNGKEKFSSRTGIEGIKYALSDLDKDDPSISRLKNMFRASIALVFLPLGCLFISILLRLL